MTDPTPPDSLPTWARTRPGGAPVPGSARDRQFAAFVGPRWETYRRKFAPFFDDPTFQPTWNWAAALSSLLGPLVGPFWFFYRKLYLVGVVIWMLPSMLLSLLWRGDQITLELVQGNSPAADDIRLLAVGVLLSTTVLAGGVANFLLFRRGQAAIRLVESQAASAEQGLPLLARVGRVNVIAAMVGGIALAVMNLAVYAGGAR